MAATAPCRICGAPLPAWERYPNLVCGACVARARDERGRGMRFSNETLLGTGFVAQVEEDGTWARVETPTEAATCWVDGRRCVAREHRFGGIVVETVEAR